MRLKTKFFAKAHHAHIYKSLDLTFFDGCQSSDYVENNIRIENRIRRVTASLYGTSFYKYLGLEIDSRIFEWFSFSHFGNHVDSRVCHSMSQIAFRGMRLKMTHSITFQFSRKSFVFIVCPYEIAPSKYTHACGLCRLLYIFIEYYKIFARKSIYNSNSILYRTLQA